MENIDNLLEELDCVTSIDTGNEESLANKCENSIATTTQECKRDLEINQVEENFEAFKKESCSKYSGSAHDIYKKLKESRSESKRVDEKPSSWTKIRSERTDQLVAPQTTENKKIDVYAEPIFGLRLINPLISSQHIESKMAGKQPIAIRNVAYHLKSGDKNADWVFAGAVVFKTSMKTSQKGSQYCTWKISDLKSDLQTISVYLFGKACSDLWKISIGTVVAILNATPFHKNEQISKDDLTLTVKSADQVMIWGGSRDYGICKAKKKNGDSCTSFVNKSLCEFCVYHVRNEYNKFSNKRTDLQFSSSGGGLVGLRNKVLGKNEVFYGGKSFSSVKPAARNNKAQKRDNQLLNVLRVNPAKKDVLRNQEDDEKLKMLSKEAFAKQVDSKDGNLSITNGLNKVKEIKVQTGSNNVEKSYVSRLHLLREAGQRMIETGELTRITLAKSHEKKGKFSFATVFDSPEATTACQPENKIDEKIFHAAKLDKNKMSDKSDKLSVINSKKHTSVGFELHIESATSDTKLFRFGVQSDISKKLIATSPAYSNVPCVTKKDEKSSVKLTRSNFDVELHVEPASSSITQKNLQENSKNTANVYISPIGSKLMDKPISQNSSKIFDQCNGSTNFEKIATPSSHAKKKIIQSTDELKLIPNKENFSSIGQAVESRERRPNSAQSRSAVVSTIIHERKKTLDKMNAISLIKKQGGLAKRDPNRVKPDIEKKKSLKRRLEEEEVDVEEKPKSDGKSKLSQRFIDLMNATSAHEDLVELTENMEQQNYFNKLEKKEQLEEKMLSTYKVPCKAVSCLKCHYKWFSASDLCRVERHPLKVIDTFKRFFKCDQCSNRTVTLEIIPLTNCKNCGNAKWSRAPMIREKIVKSDNSLCIRGDEEKHLNSISGSMNLNLLVPSE